MQTVTESDMRAARARATADFELAGRPVPAFTDAQLRAAALDYRRRDRERAARQAVIAAAEKRRAAAARACSATGGGRPVRRGPVPAQVGAVISQRDMPAEMRWIAAAADAQAARAPRAVPHVESAAVPWAQAASAGDNDGPAAAQVDARRDDGPAVPAQAASAGDNDGPARDDLIVDDGRGAAVTPTVSRADAATGAAVNIGIDGNAQAAVESPSRQDDYQHSDSVKPSTRQQYMKIAGRYNAWLFGRGYRDSDRAMAHYIGAHCNSWQAARLFVSAVKHYCVCRRKTFMGGPLVDGACRSAEYRMGAAARERARDKRAGLLWKDVDLMVDACMRGDDIKDQRDAVLLMVMSDCLLRPAEACGVLYGDIESGGRREKLALFETKTNRRGDPEYVYINRKTVKAVWQFGRRVSAVGGQEIFRSVDRHGNVGGRLTARAIGRIVKARAAQAGILKPVSGHSLRIGSAQSMAAAGCSVLEIQTAGRWKSVKTMLRYVDGFLDGAASPVARARYPRQRELRARGR